MIVPGVALLKKGNENPTCAESVPVVRNSQPANANTMRRTQRFMRNNWISIIRCHEITPWRRNGKRFATQD